MSLKHSLLALLSSKPKTGYELSKDFEGSTGFFWSATHQQIYKDLHGLEEKGYVRFREVAQKDKPDKKIYAITREGSAELKKWVSEDSPEPPSKDAFLIKLFIGDKSNSQILLADLRRQIVEHREKLRRYREIEALYFQDRENQPPRRGFQYLTLRRGLMFEESWLQWSREAERFLELGKETR
jgi:DNA-binding PadR family transcriptional regulator